MNKRIEIVLLAGLLALAAAPLRAQNQAPAASAALPLGSPAPNVSLLINGKAMALKSLLAGNRTLVLFYPAACASCDAQLQAADKSVIQTLGKMGFAVFAASPDLPADQAKTAARLSLSYPLLSDPNGAAAKAFHASGPADFLIDADGAVRFSGAGTLRGPELIAAARALKRSSKARP